MQLTFQLQEEDDWQDVAQAIYAQLRTQTAQDICKQALCIFLHGTLGVGKTTFMRYFLRLLGVEGSIKSPSYSVLQSYDIDHNPWPELHHIHHFDAYRIASTQQWHDYMFDECFLSHQICCIEWPENCQAALPAPYMHMDIECVLDQQGYTEKRSVRIYTS